MYIYTSVKYAEDTNRVYIDPIKGDEYRKIYVPFNLSDYILSSLRVKVLTDLHYNFPVNLYHDSFMNQDKSTIKRYLSRERYLSCKNIYKKTYLIYKFYKYFINNSQQKIYILYITLS